MPQNEAYVDSNGSVRQHGADLRSGIEQALRRALKPGKPTRPVDAGTRAFLRQACDAAHADGLPVEQLIIVIKAAWRDLGDPARRSRRDTEMVLDRLITACIEVYYSTPRDG